MLLSRVGFTKFRTKYEFGAREAEWKNKKVLCLLHRQVCPPAEICCWPEGVVKGIVNYNYACIYPAL